MSALDLIINQSIHQNSSITKLRSGFYDAKKLLWNAKHKSAYFTNTEILVHLRHRRIRLKGVVKK